MRLTPDKLAASLSKNLPKIIWLAGDEPLQLQETADLVRQHARQAGLIEREVYEVGANFNWSLLLEAAATMSLFASSKLIEVRLGTHKTGKEGAEVIRKLCAQQDNLPDTFLFTSAKLDATQTKSAWFKAVDTAGILVQIWPLNAQQLPRWLSQRCQAAGLILEPEALQLLAEKVEGNLLAAAQEIEKLRLLVAPQASNQAGSSSANNNQTGSNQAAPIQLSAPQLLELIQDSSRYSLFDLADACLAGASQRAVKILRGLQGEGTEAPLILWALTREIRLLNQLLNQLQTQPFNRACQNLRIWDSRKHLYQQASHNFNLASAQQLLQLAYQCDQAIKGSGASLDTLMLQLVLGFSRASLIASNPNANAVGHY